MSLLKSSDEFPVLFLLQPTKQRTIIYYNTPDQHTNNITNGVYMQPPTHTACTRCYNVVHILLYQ